METHSEEFRKRLLKKLPITGAKGERIMLGKRFFATLTDTEFIILWNTPGLEIVISPATRVYIEQRCDKLNIKPSDTAGFDLKGGEK